MELAMAGGGQLNAGVVKNRVMWSGTPHSPGWRTFTRCCSRLVTDLATAWQRLRTQKQQRETRESFYDVND